MLKKPTFEYMSACGVIEAFMHGASMLYFMPSDHVEVVIQYIQEECVNFSMKDEPHMDEWWEATLKMLKAQKQVQLDYEIDRERRNANKQV